MPWLGFGVYQIEEGPQTERAVIHALETGYRSIDTASIYGNERSVGRAIRKSGIPREDIFLTTKVWNDDQRSKRTLDAFEESLERLEVEYVDLYLVHWPVADCYVDTWRDMEKIYQSGRSKAIGVSNFLQPHLEKLLPQSDITPAVNQVEFHPRLLQPELLAFCHSRDIRMEAWSPLMQGQVAVEPQIVALAKKYQRTPAQIALRWDLQHAVITIPKSSRPERIAENAAIFDFELAVEDMELLNSLNNSHRLGPDPLSFSF